MLSFRADGLSCYGVAYSPFFDNRLAVATAANFGLAGNGRLYVLDIDATGSIKPVRHFDTQDGLFGLAWSELNENQVATANGDGTVKLFDTTTQEPFPVLAWREHAREVMSVNWCMGGAKDVLASASWDGTVKIWSPARPNSLATLAAPLAGPPRVGREAVPIKKGGAGPDAGGLCVYTAKFSPHEPALVASANSDSSVHLWDTRQASGRPVSTIPSAHMGSDCLALDWNKYRPTTIATAGVDKAVRVWDTRRPTAPTNELLGHDFAVRSVKWSPHSGDLLLSASYDTTVRAWTDDPTARHISRFADSPKGLRHVFSRHTEFAIDCDWSLWGQPGWVASVGWDSMLYIYHVD